MPCSVLISPENGMIRCSIMENNTVPSYEDACSFTCNTGYELTGSDTRTCQSNGSWSGSDVMCSRGNQLHRLCDFLVRALIINSVLPFTYYS